MTILLSSLSGLLIASLSRRGFSPLVPLDGSAS